MKSPVYKYILHISLSKEAFSDVAHGVQVFTGHLVQ